jgi:CheY-like chemotaxis protein
MYRTTCSACGKAFDAENAQECSCLQPVRSYRCPHCASCFCSDPKKVDEFWRNASPGMWQRRRAATAAPEPAGGVSEEALRRPLVLFADDDPTGRAIAARVIQALGYGVVVAADGAEALQMARLHKPELIITDALMPKLDGREMGRLFKSEAPNTKLVVITSVYKDPRYKHEAARSFAVDEYLAKPVNPLMLRDLVQKHLGAPPAAAADS